MSRNYPTNDIIGYTMTQKKVIIRGKEILERDFHPIFIDEEARLRAKQRIERGLYEVFSKYPKKTNEGE